MRTFAPDTDRRYPRLPTPTTQLSRIALARTERVMTGRMVVPTHVGEIAASVLYYGPYQPRTDRHPYP